jgi:hypothetical protein
MKPLLLTQSPQGRLSARGIIFISADYRLLPKGTGHDLLADVKDAIRFVAGDLNAQLDQTDAGLSLSSRSRIDPSSIGVAGTSAGGYCAYLCAIHAVPKPKAILSLYGMGGDFLVSLMLPAPEISDSINTLRCLRPTNISLQSQSLSFVEGKC